MVTRLVKFFWGDLTTKELKRFGLLSFIFFIIIGSYWLMRVMKDAQFALLVGYRHEPLAKMVSLIFVALALLGYNKLIDLFKKVSLFYCVCLFFGISFIILGYLIKFLSAQMVPGALLSHDLLPLTLNKLVGWLTFCFLESYGSLLPALFWSFVASNTTTDEAKRGYGMIFMLGQVGALLGAFTTYRFSAYGLGKLFMLGGLIVVLIPLLISFYARFIPAQRSEDALTEKESSTGVLEGFRLLMKYPYVAGLFVVTTSYEIIGTIVEYEMGLAVLQVYPPSLDGGAGIAAFKSLNGMAIGALSLLFAFFGTSFFMRRFGLKACLMMFPITIVTVISMLFLFYLSGADTVFLMWAFFVSEVIFRGLNYTLNNPSKEVMYIPTSMDIKFKAKSWIDMFGSRSVKGLGAFTTTVLGASLPRLLVFGTIVSWGVAGFWIFAAFLVGSTFDKLQQEKKIVG